MILMAMNTGIGNAGAMRELHDGESTIVACCGRERMAIDTGIGAMPGEDAVWA